MKAVIPSQTAEAVCWMRAAEQRRPPASRIVDDPFARLFLSPPWKMALAVWPLVSRSSVATFVLARHRAIDEALAASRGEQVVLLGAGYDSRAYRFGALTFEVDHPATARRKERLVARHRARLPEARVVRVPVDFERESFADGLLAAGFDREARTFWVWEGVSMYLQRAAVLATLRSVRALSAPGSRLAMDFWRWPDDPTWRGTFWRTTPALLHLLGEPVTFGLDPEDAAGFLGSAGLELEELADAAVLGERYVRDGRRVFPCMYVATASVP